MFARHQLLLKTHQLSYHALIFQHLIQILHTFQRHQHTFYLFPALKPYHFSLREIFNEGLYFEVVLLDNCIKVAILKLLVKLLAEHDLL